MHVCYLLVDPLESIFIANEGPKPNGPRTPLRMQQRDTLFHCRGNNRHNMLICLLCLEACLALICSGGDKVGGADGFDLLYFHLDARKCCRGFIFSQSNIMSLCHGCVEVVLYVCRFVWSKHGAGFSFDHCALVSLLILLLFLCLICSSNCKNRASSASN